MRAVSQFLSSMLLEIILVVVVYSMYVVADKFVLLSETNTLRGKCVEHSESATFL